MLQNKNQFVKVGTDADWYYDASKSRCWEVTVQEVFLSIPLLDAGGVFSLYHLPVFE